MSKQPADDQNVARQRLILEAISQDAAINREMIVMSDGKGSTITNLIVAIIALISVGLVVLGSNSHLAHWHSYLVTPIICAVISACGTFMSLWYVMWPRTRGIPYDKTIEDLKARIEKQVDNSEPLHDIYEHVFLQQRIRRCKTWGNRSAVIFYY